MANFKTSPGSARHKADRIVKYMEAKAIKPYLHAAFLFIMQGISFLPYAQTEKLKFNRLNTADGLSQNSVIAILKDYKGFMWFGTHDGLNKYDGYKYTVYKNDPENPLSISNNSIYSLTEDAAHNLWIASSGGLDRLDRAHETFIHYKTGLDKSIVFHDIFLDSKKRIWLGSTHGVFLLDARKAAFKIYENKNKKSNSQIQDYVYKIAEGDSGQLWIATATGLSRFDPETGNFTDYHNEPGNNKSIGAGFVTAVFKDSKGNVWAGTQGSGIALFNPKENNFINYRHNDANPTSIGYNDILSFAEDSKENLWIGTENGGISVFDYTTRSFKNYLFDTYDNTSLSDNSIHCLYSDNIHNMWVGTWSGGVNLLPFHGDKFMHFKQVPGNKNSLSSNLILSITGDSYGAIWIGTDGGGLNRFNRKTQTFTHYLHDAGNKNSISSNYVLSLAEAEPGILLIGYHRGGFDLFDTKTGVFTHHVPDTKNLNSLSTLTVNFVYKERAGPLWLGTWGGGVDVYDRKTNRFEHYSNNPADSNSVDNNFIAVIHEDKAGNIWVGTDAGLNLFNKTTKKFTHYIHDQLNKNSISSNTIQSMLNDKAGYLWLATGSGLNSLNLETRSFKSYREEDGLPIDMLHDILEDKNGNLWISSNQGLTKFNPHTKTSRSYGAADGLQGNEFKSRCAYKAPDGQLFFGGPNGFNVFNPDSITNNNFIPAVYITEFSIFNKPVAISSAADGLLTQHISETKEIRLSYKQSFFTLEFAALNFTLPGKNRYAYKLQNFDKEWNYVGNKRMATYTNLNPGSYVFMVKGSNNDGLWNEKGVSIKIIITPPFWLTWWFKLSLFLIIAGSIYGFYRFRLNLLQNQKMLLEQKVQEQTIQLVYLNEEEKTARLEAEQARAEAEQARVESDNAKEHAYHVNEELQLKNKQLEQFAYVASHDLQEPLRTTSGFIDLLQQKYVGRLDEKADKYLAFISDATARMKVLINDLLDFAKIGSGGELQMIDCNIMLGNLLADLMAAIQDSKADIQYADLPVIRGYPTEIKLLFQNLLINAIKFRKKNVDPRITIIAKEKQGCWEFSISDNGIGIEKKNTEKIFDIFHRLHTRKEYEGSGIGLSHCKKIVELHHGKIWIESTHGEGTTFYFTIPAADSDDNGKPETMKTYFFIHDASKTNN